MCLEHNNNYYKTVLLCVTADLRQSGSPFCWVASLALSAVLEDMILMSNRYCTAVRLCLTRKRVSLIAGGTADEYVEALRANDLAIFGTLC